MAVGSLTAEETGIVVVLSKVRRLAPRSRRTLAAVSIDAVARAWIAFALLIGSAFVALAIVYWAVPADELPSWLPGHKPRSHPAHAHHHKRHGLVAFVLGFGYLSGAYLVTRERGRR
jgi:hypothetical protein